MSSFIITLPDGSQQTVAPGSTPLDVAKSISPRLADAALVARVNGDLFDLTRPFEGDASLQLLTSKDVEALQVYRHSTASPAGRGGSGTLSRDPAWHRSPHRDRLLL